MRSVKSRLRAAGLNELVESAGARLDSAGQALGYTLLALGWLTIDDQQRIADLVKPAVYSLDMARPVLARHDSKQRQNSSGAGASRGGPTGPRTRRSPGTTR